MRIAKFKSGDGIEHEVSVDSVAFEMMSKDGAFERTDLPIDEIEMPDGETDTKAEDKKLLSKMTKPELLAEADARGLELVPDEVTKAQIIAAIEASESESQS